MKPNIRSFLGGVAVVVLLWAVVALTGGDTSPDPTTDASADTALSETEIALDGAENRSVSVIDDESVTPESATDGAAAQVEEPAPVDDDIEADATPFRYSNLSTIAPGELPIEAIDTLDLIASGGPYPYSKDDSVFQNREGFLPDRPQGHYREYTVETPGEGDRGAKRIVAGADGELYYTDDHYDSFREIVPG